jgi:hypothetical protein
VTQSDVEAAKLFLFGSSGALRDADPDIQQAIATYLNSLSGQPAPVNAGGNSDGGNLSSATPEDLIKGTTALDALLNNTKQQPSQKTTWSEDDCKQFAENMKTLGDG